MISQYHVGIVSAHRPHRVSACRELCAPYEPTFYVPASQSDAYLAEGARLQAVDKALPNVTFARNAVLNSAEKLGLPCVILDDDILGWGTIGSKANKSLSWALGELEPHWNESEFPLAGWMGSGNPLYAARLPVPVSTWGFLAYAVAVKPSPVRYDESILHSEDIDFDLMHHRQHGGILRLNTAYISRLPIQSKGGFAGFMADQDRTQLSRDEALKVLAKHPGLVRLKGDGTNYQSSLSVSWKKARNFEVWT